MALGIFRFSSEAAFDNPLRAHPSDPSDRSGKYVLKKINMLSSFKEEKCPTFTIGYK